LATPTTKVDPTETLCVAQSSVSDNVALDVTVHVPTAKTGMTATPFVAFSDPCATELLSLTFVAGDELGD
jgi:hypothetical protein